VTFNRASALLGRLADASLPQPMLRAAIAAYSAWFRLDLSEVQRAPGQFRSFGDFFARELKPGMRPVDATQGTLVSPADGTLGTFGPVADGLITQVKGHDYRLADLIGDEDDARTLERGTFVTIYLSPRDYHRVHSPEKGRIAACRHLPGALYSVRPLFVRGLANLFTTNERMAIRLETAHGLLYVVMVAATVVGRVVLTFVDLETNSGDRRERARRFDRPIPIERGQELGAFQLGSTVVVIAGKGYRPHALAEGLPMRMGQPLLSLSPTPR
jgi:phosphatidylserine decarboxylase